MKSIIVIAQNTFREIIRDRILYGLVVFALLFIGISLVLGQLSFAEQQRISINFGFMAVHLSAVILSVFVGSTLVSKEIEKKTIMTLLARSLTRFEFLAGKFLGLMAVTSVIILGLSLILMMIFMGLRISIGLPFFLGMLGVLLESSVLLSLAILFSTFSRPVMVVSFSLGVFLIGHWVESFSYFAKKSQSTAFMAVDYIVQVVVPHLEVFNWRGLLVYGEMISLQTFLIACLHALVWIVLCFSASTLIVWRKDFG